MGQRREQHLQNPDQTVGISENTGIQPICTQLMRVRELESDGRLIGDNHDTTTVMC